MTSPQLRLGQVSLQTAASVAQLRLGEVTLAAQAGPQLRLGLVTLQVPAAPTLTIAVAPGSGNLPLTVAVTTTGADPQGGSLTYSTSWGDGGAPTSGPNPGHTYTAAGSYTVTTTVTSSSGLTAVATATVTVLASPKRRIFAVATPAGAKPVLFLGAVLNGQLVPAQVDGLLAGGVLVDPNGTV
jgi:PKD repeat protein